MYVSLCLLLRPHGAQRIVLSDRLGAGCGCGEGLGGGGGGQLELSIRQACWEVEGTVLL